METILQFDQILFSFINQDLANPFLDTIMPYWREKTTWIPLYLLILVLAFVKLHWKQAVLFLVLLAGTVGVADQISSQWIKKSVERLRPCRNAAIQEEVHLLVPCGSGYSFTSSHATNHFAVAFFIAFILFTEKRIWRIALLCWAATIAFGQVYVGVHYPLDVTAGALLGLGIGWGMLRLYNMLVATKYWQKLNTEHS
ncbi:MAG: phosphatase PAP2 family protein [Bacteroidota bacterium]